MEQLKFLKNGESAIQNFERVIDFRNESVLDRNVSRTTSNQMTRFVERVTDSLAALRFLVATKEIVREIEEITMYFTNFYYKNVINLNAKNEDIVKLRPKLEELKQLFGLLKNETHYYYEARNSKSTGYNIRETNFANMGFDKIVIKELDKTEQDNDSDDFLKSFYEEHNTNDSEEQEENKKYNLFFNEIGSGWSLQHYLKHLVEVQGGSFEDIQVYGSNENPETGKSVNGIEGFQTMRGGPRRLSPHFASIAFENRTAVEMFEKDSAELIKKKPIKDTMSDNNVVVFSGYEVILMYCYDIKSFASRNRSMKIESVALLDKRAGLISVVYKKRSANKAEVINNSSIINRTMHSPESLPERHVNGENNEYIFEIEKRKKPNSFFGRVVSIEDIKEEFTDSKPTIDRIFDMGEKKRINLMSDMSLQEVKPGHIPTLATTGITSGRYVDEVLKEVADQEKGFDHIVCTKIVKRLVEEEEEERASDGTKITKHIEKMANVIISQAITPQGEFVELFNNDTDTEDDDEAS